MNLQIWLTEWRGGLRRCAYARRKSYWPCLNSACLIEHIPLSYRNEPPMHALTVTDVCIDFKSINLSCKTYSLFVFQVWPKSAKFILA